MSNSKKAGTKKILSVLLAVALIVGCLPAVALPAAAFASSKPTEGLSYGYVTLSYTESEIVTVDASTTLNPNATETEVQDTTYEMKLYAVTGYSGTDTEIVVPPSVDGVPVDFVASYAFSGKAITSVTLPDTIKGIDEGAFFDCSYLTTVIIGSNAAVNKFGNFSSYSKAENMLSAVVGDTAFANCPLLRHFAVYTSALAGTLGSTFGSNVFSGDSNITFYGWGDSNLVKTCQASLGDSTTDYKNLETIETYVLGLEISPISLFMSVDEKCPLTVSVIPESASSFLDKYSFTSSDYGVVEISDDGVITAVGNGVATVSAYTINGFRTTCEVTVSERVYGDYIYRFSSGNEVSIVKFNPAVSGEVTIPETINGYRVTGIDAYAFRDCVKITAVTFPDTIEIIGTGAFYGCTYLSKINISSSSGLKTIGNSAFYGCTSLSYAEFDFALETIGAAAFRDCTSLAAVSIPATVVNIGDQAFYGTPALAIFTLKGKTLAVNNSYEYFGSGSIVTVFADGTFTSLKNYATSRSIPFVAYDGTSIADEVEFDPACKTSLVLGEKVQYSATVDGAAPTTVVAYVSDDATVVRVNANGVATALAEGTAHIYAILCDGTSDVIDVEVKYGESGDFLYKLLDNNTKAEISAYRNETASEVTVPDTISFDGNDIPVVSVGTGAFTNALKLKTVNIGAGIVSLSGASFDCAYALEEITVDAANTYFSSLNGVLYNKQRTSLLKFPAAKQGDTYTASFTVPSNVASIGDYAFKDNINLVQINLAAKISKIGAHSFESTERLMNLELPSLVESIGEFAFAYNSTLKYVLIRQAASSIASTAFVGSASAQIYGYKGYAAESFADEHSMTFIDANLLVRISELRLSDTSYTLNKGYNYTITPEVFPTSSAITDYYFKSFDPSVASVTAAGLVTGIAEGETDILVYSSNGVYSICHISVVVDSGLPLEVECTGLRIALSPDSTTYESGEEPNLKGMIVYADYSDGSSRKIIYDDEVTGESFKVSGVRLRGYDKFSDGGQTVTIVYNECTVNFGITYLAPYVTAVAVSALPDKIVYVTGQSFDSTGLVLAATYSNGTVEEVKTGFTTTDITAKIGIQTITAAYEGFKCTFDVTVKEREVVSISLEGPKNKELLEGSALDLDGLVITATYDNGTTGLLSLSDVVISGYDSSVIGPQVVTVTYITADSVEISNAFTVTVKAKTLTGIEIIAQPDKQEYILGEKIDITGLTVVAVYDNNTYDLLQPENMYDYDNLVLSLAENTITIAYQGFTDTFTVFVRVGNYNDQFEYKVINGNEIEIIKKCSATAVSGDYVIPEQIDGMNVTSIQKNAFKDCDLLTSVTIPDTVTAIGTSAFEGCDKLRKVTLSTSLTKIPDKCFYGCPKLDNVVIPDSVESIGDLAFARCTALKSITIPGSVYAISADAFKYSPNTVIAAPAGSYAYEYAQGMVNKPILLLKDVPDITGDGFVTTDDARLALRVAASLETIDAAAKAKGDVDGDGVITTTDARVILRIVAQLDKYEVG